MATCNPNTLLASGARFQGAESHSQHIVAVTLLETIDGGSDTVKSLLAAGAGFQAGQSRDLKICACVLVCNILTTITGMASCNINTLLAQGAAFQALQDGDLNVVLCQLLCNLTTAITPVNGTPSTAAAGYLYNTGLGKYSPVTLTGAAGSQVLAVGSPI